MPEGMDTSSNEAARPKGYEGSDESQSTKIDFGGGMRGWVTSGEYFYSSSKVWSRIAKSSVSLAW